MQPVQINFEHIWYNSVHTTFEETEEWEPDLSTFTIALLQSSIISQSMVIKEKSGGDIKGDEHVDRVMFVSGQNKEDSEKVQHPRQGVNEVEVGRGVLSDEKIEQREYNGMSTEHVVTTSSNALHGHATTLPDDVCLDQSFRPTTIRSGLALQVAARHRKGRD